MLYSIIFLSLIQSAVIYYREMLVNRAVTVYDGNSLRKQPEDSDVLVCEECASIHIEIQAWVNANTDEFISDVEIDRICTSCGCDKDTARKYRRRSLYGVGAVCGERLSLVIYKNEYGNESKQTPDFTGCQRAIADYLNFLASKQS